MNTPTRARPTLLMCFEADAAACHRTLLLARFAEALPIADVAIAPLRPMRDGAALRHSEGLW